MGQGEATLPAYVSCVAGWLWRLWRHWCGNGGIGVICRVFLFAILTFFVRAGIGRSGRRLSGVMQGHHSCVGLAVDTTHSVAFECHVKCCGGPFSSRLILGGDGSFRALKIRVDDREQLGQMTS